MMRHKLYAMMSRLLGRTPTVPPPGPGKVVPWKESGFYFPGRPKRKDTRKVVVHWTGGEGGARQFYRTMRQRDLSVHFFIDGEGTTYQMCEMSALCAHAKGVNVDSVGIEVACRGLAPPLKHFSRSTRLDMVHGVTVETCDFREPQLLALTLLCVQLCTEFSLPRVVPMNEDGSVLARVMPLERLREYRGVMGHYHASRGKVDPGTHALRELQRRMLADVC